MPRSGRPRRPGPTARSIPPPCALVEPAAAATRRAAATAAAAETAAAPAAASSATTTAAPIAEGLGGAVEHVEEAVAAVLQRATGGVTDLLHVGDVRHVDPATAAALVAAIAAAQRAARNDDRAVAAERAVAAVAAVAAAEHGTAGGEDVAVAAVPGRGRRVDGRELAHPGVLEPEGDGVGQVLVEDALRLVQVFVLLDRGEVLAEGAPLGGRLGAGRGLARHHTAEQDERDRQDAGDDDREPDERRDRGSGDAGRDADDGDDDEQGDTGHPPMRARGLGGAEEVLAIHQLLVERLLDLPLRALEERLHAAHLLLFPLLQLGAEEDLQELPLEGAERGVGGEQGEREVAAAVAVRLVDLDHAAAAEIDQRRHHVLLIGPLVQEGAGGAGGEIVRRVGQEVGDRAGVGVAAAAVPEAVKGDGAAGGEEEADAEEDDVEQGAAVLLRFLLLALGVVGGLPGGRRGVDDRRELEAHL